MMGMQAMKSSSMNIIGGENYNEEEEYKGERKVVSISGYEAPQIDDNLSQSCYSEDDVFASEYNNSDEGSDNGF